MSNELPAGPYKFVELRDGSRAPFYIIRFDKDGLCSGLAAREHLMETVGAGEFTDLFLFSHGWNNDWAVATKRYDDFIQSYRDLVEERQLDLDRPFRPMFVGIFWPSTALVMPWERGPQIAAAPDVAREDEEREYLEMLAEVADLVAKRDVESFYELAGKATLNEMEAGRLAEILAPIYGTTEDPLEDEAENLGADDLVSYWKEVFPEPHADAQAGGDDDFGFAGESFGAPQAAGIFSFLNPRKPIRALTVWKMKDRAGVVGGRGVHLLLRDLLGADDNHQVHLVGHSYGCKVVLSAACAGPLPRKVDSALLLQPAINGFCFSGNVAGEGFSGGYRSAFSVIRQPILSSFSKHDVPLTKLFHLALRRKKDLGEIQIAAAPPSRYAALGGFGPQGCTPNECAGIDMLVPPERYALNSDNGPEVFGVNSDRHIDGHGGIVSEATAWALYCQVEATRTE